MLAGCRQIFVRLTGCNLGCRYCDTDFEPSAICHVESAPGSGIFINHPPPLSLHNVSALIEEWCLQLPGAHHSVSITGGEPLIHADTLVQWLPDFRKILPIHLETNGTLSDALKLVNRYLDYISMDMKLPSTAACSESLWGDHARFLQGAQGKHVSVKVVIGETTPDNEIRQVCELIAAVDATVPLFLQPLSLPDGTIGIPASHVLHLQGVASARLPDVRVIPQMHKLLGAL